MQLSPKKLIMVTGENNNKFYSMFPKDDGTFEVKWGRVGVTESTTVYPISKWDSQYNSKIKKGYKDVTNLHKVTTGAKKSGFAKITEPKIDSLFAALLGYSKNSVAENYTISSDAVTDAQVREAQAVLNDLVNAKIGADKNYVNRILLNLYQIIPRRMAKVQNHLVPGQITTHDELQFLRSIIDNEQKTLDVMAGQVAIKGNDLTDDDAAQQTLLDALGIIVDLGTSADEALVRRVMDIDKNEFKAVYRVTNIGSRKRYVDSLKNAINKKEELFWHGSRNENWISILKTDLMIRPTNAVYSGSMFGDGIYFADKYRKSAGYTSLAGSYWARGSQNTAFLALMDVHVGKQYDVHHHNHECYKFCADYLKRKGEYDSVFAHGGADLRNNEYIVYRSVQSTIKYLVQVGR